MGMWFGWLVATAVLLLTEASWAVGSVTVANTEIQEQDGRWRVKVTINLGSTPQLGHIPMIFSFTPVAIYERQLTDQSGEKPVMVRLNLTGQVAKNESMDVGFADVSGKLFALTKFDFVLKREREYEAGEYVMKVKRESDGAEIGKAITLKLKGDNKVIDRRAMDFTKTEKGEKGVAMEKVPGDSASAKAQAEAQKKRAEEDEAAAKADPNLHDVDDETTAPATPPSAPPKQGGCGCVLAGHRIDHEAWLAAALAIGLGGVILRRRTA